MNTSHNPEVAGSNPVPAIWLSPLRPVIYDWPFCCAEVDILGLGVPGACLGVPVLTAKSTVAGVKAGFDAMTSGAKTFDYCPETKAFDLSLTGSISSDFPPDPTTGLSLRAFSHQPRA